MPWNTLPTELKLAVIDLLDDQHALLALSVVNNLAYQLCLPRVFDTVKLVSAPAIQTFLANVPQRYCTYIHHLTLSNAGPNDRTSADLVQLLNKCTAVRSLRMEVTGSPSSAIISCFESLVYLNELAIANISREEESPLSERLAVSIALSVPSLRSLTLERITRSAMHALEHDPAFPSFLAVKNDQEVPSPSSTSKSEIPLCLPSLLTIPTLQTLRILDSHLGDPRWLTTAVHSTGLSKLELGHYAYESDAFHRECVQRIVSAIGGGLKEFTLSTPLVSAFEQTSAGVVGTGAGTATAPSSPIIASPTFAFPNPLQTQTCTQMHNLRSLTLTSLFPIDDILPTLTAMPARTPSIAFSTSPLERLKIQCFLKDDVPDVCTALEEFLIVRAEKGEKFYAKLKRVEVEFDMPSDCDATEDEESKEAKEKLRELGYDVGVDVSFVTAAEKTIQQPVSHQPPQTSQKGPAKLAVSSL